MLLDGVDRVRYTIIFTIFQESWKLMSPCEKHKETDKHLRINYQALLINGLSVYVLSKQNVRC